MLNPMYEIVNALTFDGLPIGARPRRDSDGRPMDHDAGWVAYWPADTHRWIMEFARPASEQHLYVRFRLDETLQTWPWTTVVKLYDEGWVMVPTPWTSTNRDLRPRAEEVLTHLEQVNAGQVARIRKAIGAAAGAARTV